MQSKASLRVREGLGNLILWYRLKGIYKMRHKVRQKGLAQKGKTHTLVIYNVATLVVAIYSSFIAVFESITLYI